MTSGVLLDTDAAIWLREESIDTKAFEEIVRAGLAGVAYVSPVTAWEIGLLSRPERSSRALPQFLPDPRQWYLDLVGNSLLTETALTAGILVASSNLPGGFHNDPADGMLVATARALDCALVTSDRKILAYGAQGHLAVIPCRVMS